MQYFSNLFFHGLLSMGHVEKLYYMKYMLGNTYLWRRLMETSPDRREEWGDENAIEIRALNKHEAWVAGMNISITQGSRPRVWTYMCRSRLTLDLITLISRQKKNEMQHFSKYEWTALRVRAWRVYQVELHRGDAGVQARTLEFIGPRR